MPAFESVDQHGNKRKSDEFSGKPLVIYFYPKDETKGCTAQACSFRDSYQDFQDAGAEVIGISADSVESHLKFAEHHRLPFVLLADTDKKMRTAFNVKGDLLGLIPGRETFVFDKGGKLVHKFRSQAKIQQHIKQALETISQ